MDSRKCGYEYDPVASNSNNNIAPVTVGEDIVDAFLYPIYGLGKGIFEKV